MSIFEYNNLRLRFPPSPTGYLHIGAVRSILFNIFLARKSKGKWLLRIEDTDRNRLKPDAFKDFMKGLEIMFLEPDEGVTFTETEIYNSFYEVYEKGDFGSYIQSQRLDTYFKHANIGIKKKIFYWSNMSKERIKDLQEKKQLVNKPINWYKESEEKDSEILYLSVEEVINNREKYPNACLRYKLQREGIVKVPDYLLGEMEFDLSLLEDPIFLKSDNFPSYHLAHLVDDQLMKIDIVVRTAEWVASSGLNYQSYIDFWGEENIKFKYLHAPFILGETGNKKMSKRDGNVNMSDYLKKGYTPEAMVNYLAFLGWNPGIDREMYY
jgi:glutamyl/glutaminyl-tRNA synthetase